MSNDDDDIDIDPDLKKLLESINAPASKDSITVVKGPKQVAARQSFVATGAGLSQRIQSQGHSRTASTSNSTSMFSHRVSITGASAVKKTSSVGGSELPIQKQGTIGASSTQTAAIQSQEIKKTDSNATTRRPSTMLEVTPKAPQPRQQAQSIIAMDATREASEELNDEDIKIDDDDLNDPELQAELEGLHGDKKHESVKSSTRISGKQGIATSALDIDDGDVEKDLNVELTEEDMDDPDLLAELNSLAPGSVAIKPKSAPKPAPVPVQDIQAKILAEKKKAAQLHKEGKLEEAKAAFLNAKRMEDAAAGKTTGVAASPVVASKPALKPAPKPIAADVDITDGDVEKDVNVELTEEDMDDPDLLAELDSIAPGSSAALKAQAKPTPKPAPAPVQDIQAKILAEKKKAAQLHKEGKLEEAKAAFLNAKNLEAAAAGKATISPPAAAPPAKPVTKSQPVADIHIGDDDVEKDLNVELTEEDMDDPELLAELNSLAPGSVAIKPKPTPKPAPAPVQDIQAKIFAEKKKAAQLHKEGKLEEAKAAFLNAKRMEETANKVTVAPQTAPKSAPIEADIGDDDVEKDVNVELTEEDMDDPELLAELDSIAPGSSAALKAQAKPTPKPASIPAPVQDIQAKIFAEKKRAAQLHKEGKLEEAKAAFVNAKRMEDAAAGKTTGVAASPVVAPKLAPKSAPIEADIGDDDVEKDVNVELTEEDMDDPDLLAELDSIAPGSSAALKAQAKPSQKTVTPPPTVSAQPLQDIQGRILAEKKRAAQLHKEGKLEEAKAAFLNAKNMEAAAAGKSVMPPPAAAVITATPLGPSKAVAKQATQTTTEVEIGDEDVEKDVNVELDDEDLDDPELLAELDNINKRSSANTKAEAPKKSVVEAEIIQSKLSISARGGGGPVPSPKKSSKQDVMTQIMILKKKIQEETEAGNKEKVAALKSQLAGVEERFGLSSSSSSSSASSSSGGHARKGTIDIISGMEGEINEADLNDELKKLESTEAEEGDVEYRIKELKKKAVELNRMGNKQEAMKVFTQAKALEAQYYGKKTSHTGSVSSASTRSASMKSVVRPRLPGEVAVPHDQLIKALRAEIVAARDRAQKMLIWADDIEKHGAERIENPPLPTGAKRRPSFTAGEKEIIADAIRLQNLLAERLHKEANTWLAYAKSCEEIERSAAGKSVGIIRWENASLIDITKATINDIAYDEIELSIQSFDTKTVTTAIEAGTGIFVKYSTGISIEAGHDGLTSMKPFTGPKGQVIEFNVTEMIKIARTTTDRGRGLLRKIHKRRATFEIYARPGVFSATGSSASSTSKFFGLFKAGSSSSSSSPGSVAETDKSLGKVTIDLSDLLVTVMVGSPKIPLEKASRAVGGTLGVSLRIQSPFVDGCSGYATKEFARLMLIEWQ